MGKLKWHINYRLSKMGPFVYDSPDAAAGLPPPRPSMQRFCFLDLIASPPYTARQTFVHSLPSSISSALITRSCILHRIPLVCPTIHRVVYPHRPSTRTRSFDDISPWGLIVDFSIHAPPSFPRYLPIHQHHRIHWLLY